jgi:hypothetical protein
VVFFKQGQPSAPRDTSTTSAEYKAGEGCSVVVVATLPASSFSSYPR